MKALLSFVFLAPLLSAQSPIPDALTTAGTTRLDGEGRRWGFVAINATNPASLSGRTLAVFVKPAGPDDAGAFSRVAVLARATDAPTIKPLLERAEALGENIPLLDSVTTELWAFTRWNDEKQIDPGTPPPAPPYSGIPPLAERLAGFQQRAQSDPEMAQSLQILAAGRPSIRQMLGQGWAGVLPVAEGGVATVEIRDWNPAAQASVSVLGRVVLEAADPLPLPPPGAPWVLPEENARGELNLKLRWASPPELARRSLTQAGFNLWRLPKAAGAPPFPAQPSLEELVAAGAVRVNRTSAILPNKAFTAGNPAAATDVTNVAEDASTFFFADDNDRFHGGTAFRDGEQFYYFATARDLLGRDGMVSPGTLATACRRVPPPAPQELRVDNDYTFDEAAPGAGQQGFRISWKPLASDPTQIDAPGATTETVYEVVKGEDLDVLNDPRLRAGLMPIDFSAADQPLYPQAFGTQVPDAPGVPAITVTDYSTDPGALNFRNTFFFVVRAVRVLKIDGVLACRTPGPYCAPVMAALHDREGPTAPAADVVTVLARALVKVETSGLATPDTPVPPGETAYRLVCRRVDEAIEWAEFRYAFSEQGGQTLSGSLGRHFFAEGQTEVSVDFTLPFLPGNGGVRRSYCRVGGHIGTVSREGDSFQEIGADGERVNVTQFVAGELSPLTFDPAHPLADELWTEPVARTLAAITAENLDDAYFSAQTAFAVGSEVLIQVNTGAGAWRFLGVDFVASQSPIVRTVRFLDGPRAAPPLFTARPLRAWQMRSPDTAGGEIVVPIVVPSAPPPDDPGGSGPVVIFGKLTGKAREYRIYRQVADGPLTMVKQGTDDPPNKENFNPGDKVPKFAFADGLRIPSCVPRTYYLQVFDKEGNPSPMTILWQDLCLGVKLPKPRLSEPKPGGTDAEPVMVVEWFCEPEGVERFEFIVTGTSQTSLSLAGLTVGATYANGGSVQFGGSAKTKLIFKDTQLTPVVGGPQFHEASAPFSRSGPRFRAHFPVGAGTSYRLVVRAVDGMKNRGEFSTSRTFEWKPPPDLNDPAIPWPVRPLPPVSGFPAGVAAGSGVQAVALPINEPEFNLLRGGMDVAASGEEIVAGVRIGRQFVGGQDVGERAGGPVFTPLPGSPAYGRASFAGLLFTQPGAQPGRNDVPLPAVLYREQVAGPLFPVVSGEVMQVSPMITQVREVPILAGELPGKKLLDPYLAVRQTANFQPTGRETELYLLDTQPAISGATYRYHLLRFDPISLEPVQTIPCGEVTIP